MLHDLFQQFTEMICKMSKFHLLKMLKAGSAGTLLFIQTSEVTDYSLISCLHK